MLDIDSINIYRRILFSTLLLSLTVIFATTDTAAIEMVTFEDSATAQRYQTLIEELRCLVCQNQNLADSDADLAKDLRRKTAEMLVQGKTDQEILNYMRVRYGDFVLYRPPFNWTTAILWVGPFMLLFCGVISLLIKQHRRQADKTPALTEVMSENQRNKIRALLAQDFTDDSNSIGSADD